MIEFEISNEMNVREWFAAYGAKLGYTIVVSQSAFPDYVLKDAKGKLYRVEVEYQSVNFLQHKHDPNGCDFILCWHHTLRMMLPVLELRTGKMYEPNEHPLYPVDDGRRSQQDVERDNKRKAIEVVASIDGLQNRFLSAIADDMKAVSTYQQALYEPRIKLQSISVQLVRALESAGIRVHSKDPYDVFHYLFS